MRTTIILALTVATLAGCIVGEIASRAIDVKKDIHQAAAQCGGIIEPTFRAKHDQAIWDARDYALAHKECKTVSWVY